MATSVGTLSVKVMAETRALTMGLARAQGEVRNFTTKTRAFMQANAATIAMLKRAFMMLGIAAVAGVAMVVKTFADLEQGLIEVAKRTGFAGEELRKFKEELEELSVTMSGISIKNLQSIAAIAGQLGIQGAKNILIFTETIAQMGVATNLSADEAATGMARLGVVLGEDISQTQRMGSVMNELSNNTTATSSDILDLSLRMGGAAKTLEITTPEVLGLSATLRDLGVMLQVGGTAMSQVMMKMLTDTDKFATASGMSFEKYAALVKRKPIEAIIALGENLGKMDKMARAEALEGLGLTGVRVAGTLMKLANASEIVRKNLRMANDEWGTGTSLQKEYETAAKGLTSQLITLKNIMIIVAGYIGEGLAPAIKTLIKYVKENAEEVKEWAKSMGENLSRFAKWFIGDFIPTMVGAWNVLKAAIYLTGEGIGFVMKISAQMGLVASMGLSKTAKENLRVAEEFIKECKRMRVASYENVIATKEWGEKFKAFSSGIKDTKDNLNNIIPSINKTTGGLGDMGDEVDNVINKKKDFVSELIGAFEWKPPAMAFGGGAALGYQPTLGTTSKYSEKSGITYLNVTMPIAGGKEDLRRGFNKVLDRMPSPPN